LLFTVHRAGTSAYEIVSLDGNTSAKKNGLTPTECSGNRSLVPIEACARAERAG
jgi:hypothetical protein